MANRDDKSDRASAPEQDAALATIEQLTEVAQQLQRAQHRQAEGAAADAYTTLVAARQALQAAADGILPRQRQALKAQLDKLNADIEPALRAQVRQIFVSPALAAQQLRSNYLRTGDGQVQPEALPFLLSILIEETENHVKSTNPEKAPAAWQAVYDASAGSDPALAHARKIAASHLPPWWKKYLPLLIGAGVVVILALTAFLVLRITPPDQQTAIITSLEPDTMVANGQSQQLVIHGENLSPDAKVFWNDQEFTPTTGSATALTLTLDATLIAPGDVRITVQNGAGERPSNEKILRVTAQLTATPTASLTPTITPTATPTATPTPSSTPTPTSTAVVGDLPCHLVVTGSDGDTATSNKLQWSVGKGVSDTKSVEWTGLLLLPGGDRCGSENIEEITGKSYRLVAKATIEPLVLPQPQDVRIRWNEAGDAELNVSAEVSIRTDKNITGTAEFTLEYQVATDEWKPVERLTLALPWQIIIATPTPTVTPTRTATATPTASPTPSFYNEAPTLLEPIEGQTFYTDERAAFKWQWTGPFSGDQVFQLQIWRGDNETGAKTWTAKEPSLTLNANEIGTPENYSWRVVAWDNHSKREVSNRSETRRFVLRERQHNEPNPTNTPRP